VKILAMQPISECDVKKYLSVEKRNEIIKKIEKFFNKILSDCINIKEVKFGGRDEMCRDDDGYVNSSISRLGKYVSKDKIIWINVEILAEKINNINDEFLYKFITYPDFAYLLCDLVFIHEYMHAYQELVEQKKMKKDDLNLERDADNKAIAIFMSQYQEADEVKKEISNKYIKYRQTYYNR